MLSSWASSSHINWYHSPCFPYSIQPSKHVEHTLLYYALHKGWTEKIQILWSSYASSDYWLDCSSHKWRTQCKNLSRENLKYNLPVVVFYLTDKCYFSIGSWTLSFEVVSFSSGYQEIYWIDNKEAAKISIPRYYIVQLWEIILDISFCPSECRQRSIWREDTTSRHTLYKFSILPNLLVQ